MNTTPEEQAVQRQTTDNEQNKENRQETSKTGETIKEKEETQIPQTQEEQQTDKTTKRGANKENTQTTKNEEITIEQKPQTTEDTQQEGNNPKEKKENKSPAKTKTPRTGRKTVMTPETIQKILTALKNDMTMEEAAAYAGISRATLFDHAQKNKHFSAEIAQSKHRAFVIAKNTVSKGLQQDPEFALKRLSKRQNDRYNEKKEVEHTGVVSLAALYGQSKETEIIEHKEAPQPTQHQGEQDNVS